MRLLRYQTIAISLALGALWERVAHAAGLEDAGSNLRGAGSQAFGDSVVDAAENEGYLPALIGNIIGIFLLVIGGLFMLLLIYGGYMWMTARGDTERVKKAKEVITNALIGLVIVFAAYAISAFVLSRIVAATQFQTP